MEDQLFINFIVQALGAMSEVTSFSKQQSQRTRSPLLREKIDSADKVFEVWVDNISY